MSAEETAKGASLEDLLLEMKNTSELMVDLAYSAVLYDSADIAEEVAGLEEAVDEMHRAVQTASMQAYGYGEVTLDRALACIRLAQAAETIADSANMIADVVLRDVELHPILRMSIQESDTSITRVRVDEGSALDRRTLGAAHVARDTGMWIIAIRRGRNWIYGPGTGTELYAGDMLISRGPSEGVEALRELARGTGAPSPDEAEEDLHGGAGEEES